MLRATASIFMVEVSAFLVRGASADVLTFKSDKVAGDLPMNTQADIGEIADRIRAAYRGTPIAPIRSELPDLDVDAAYSIQQRNTAFWEKEGRRVVGSKIGLTSRAVQKQLGVDRPDFGMLFADMIVGEDEPVAVGRVLQPKIEAEVAFVLDRDIDLETPTVADIIRAVAYVMPALEIVGSRITNWDIGIVDTVADNASSGLFVLGGPVRRLDGLDLRAMEMRMTRGEEIVSQGSGAACLGNPLNAMVWLAGEVARRKRSLRAGDVVLSGALGPMVPVSTGDVVEATITGLGTVSARFA
nr:fumarylacetoacetate hydrolase family protein [Rhodopseudomonas palustris]